MLDYASLQDHGDQFVERILQVLEGLVRRRHQGTSTEAVAIDTARIFLAEEAEEYHREHEERLVQGRRSDSALLAREHYLARGDVARLRDLVEEEPAELLEHRGDLARYVGRVQWLLAAHA